MAETISNNNKIRSKFNWSSIYEANDEYFNRTSTSRRTKDEFLPLLVGILSLSLALFVALLDEIDGVGCARDSISHYYYAPIAGPYFVITLSFVSAFMFAYRGQNVWDGLLTTAGAIAAIVVALFPTAGIGCRYGQSFDHRLTQYMIGIGSEQGGVIKASRPAEFEASLFETILIGDQTYLIANELSQKIHFVAALVLIGSLIALSFIHLKRRFWIGNYIDKGGKKRRLVGRIERSFTSICVVLMVAGAALVWLGDTAAGQSVSLLFDKGLVLFRHNVLQMDNTLAVPRYVYHGEWLALVGFGMAWLVQWFNYWRWLDRLPGIPTPDSALSSKR